MHFWDGSWHMGWTMFWWWGLGLVLFAVLLWAVLMATRGPASPREGPEDILKRRYASGEIDRETYLRMLADLRGERAPPHHTEVKV